ncbi:MAG: glycosyltransferase [Bacteroidia bacterium]
MRILFTLTPAFDPNAGGVQRTTYKLGKYFSEQGLSVAYYSLSDKGHVEVEYGVLFSAPENGRNKNPKNIRDLKEVLHKWQPDIVINQMPYEKELREVLSQNKQTLGFVLLGCLRNSLFSFKSNARENMGQMLPSPLFKLLDNSLGIGIIQKRHWLKHRKDLMRILDAHDRFILFAPPNQQELEHFVGNYKSEKVLAIPNSIPEVFSGDVKKEKIILHVGRLNIQQKRSDLLLDFWEHAHDRLPDWRFVIVGDGPYMNALKADLKKRNLPRVDMEGYQKPEPYYKKASIFMMPSAYEGFPNTLIEAQSYGCAVLAFDSYGVLGWIVKEGNDALLSKPFDATHMATQAVRLAADSEALHTMQRAALTNAGRFTIDRVGEVWLRLFDELKKVPTT